MLCSFDGSPRGALPTAEAWTCARVGDCSSYLLQRAESAPGSALEKKKKSDVHWWLHQPRKKEGQREREKRKKRRSAREKEMKWEATTAVKGYVLFHSLSLSLPPGRDSSSFPPQLCKSTSIFGSRIESLGLLPKGSVRASKREILQMPHSTTYGWEHGDGGMGGGVLGAWMRKAGGIPRGEWEGALIAGVKDGLSQRCSGIQLWVSCELWLWGL